MNITTLNTLSPHEVRQELLRQSTSKKPTDSVEDSAISSKDLLNECLELAKKINRETPNILRDCARMDTHVKALVESHQVLEEEDEALTRRIEIARERQQKQNKERDCAFYAGIRRVFTVVAKPLKWAATVFAKTSFQASSATTSPETQPFFVVSDKHC